MSSYLTVWCSDCYNLLVPTQVTVSLVEIALKIIIPFKFLASHC